LYSSLVPSLYNAHMQTIPVSVLIIAQNAEATLKRCLDSLKDYEEIIIIDGGSKDQTESIARSYPNVKFTHNPWPGFIEQRNVSLEKATLDWCLMMDSDEAATPELNDYIRKLDLNALPKKMYKIMRTEYFEGHAVEYGFGSSDFQERFFKRQHIRYSGGNHHNHLIDGVLCTHDHPEMGEFPTHLRILHNPDYSLDQMMMKLPRFSILIANEKLERGRSTNAFVVVLSFIGTFVQVMLKSWRAGRIGFIMTMMEALHRCMVKLYIYNVQHIRKGQMDKEFRSKKLG